MPRKTRYDDYNVPGYRVTRDQPYRSVEQRRMKGCCNPYSTYLKSVQGICKILFIFFDMLVFAIIGASPYMYPVFVLDYQVWPFHIVMMCSIVCWLVVIAALFFFVGGFHLEKAHVAWPKKELIFNIVIFIVMFFGAIVEFTNVWRWDLFNAPEGVGKPGDYVRQYGLGFGGIGAVGISGLGGGFGGGGFGSNPALITQNCGIDPRFCESLVQVMFGVNNPYLANHIFASIMLVLVLIVQLTALISSYKTYKRFKRDMSRGGVDPEPKAGILTRIRYWFWEAKNTSANAIREKSTSIKEKISKLASRDDEVDGTNQVQDGDDVTKNDVTKDSVTKPPSSIVTSRVESEIHTVRESSGYRSDNYSVAKSSRKSDKYPSEKNYPRSEKSSRSSNNKSSRDSNKESSREVRSNAGSRSNRESRDHRSNRGSSEGRRSSEDSNRRRRKRSEEESSRRSRKKREEKIPEKEEPKPESPGNQPPSNHMASFVV